MSRPMQARPSTPSAGRGPGRHRIERAGGVRVTDLPAVRERLQTERGAQQRNAFLRWLLPTVPSGRHTWNFLAMSGGRPRTAFAIILSL
ncbi:hypothetical protein ACI8AF_17685 [Blastococcus sp. SYSU D00669]